MIRYFRWLRAYLKRGVCFWIVGSGGVCGFVGKLCIEAIINSKDRATLSVISINDVFECFAEACVAVMAFF